jgi:hypothetical protein
MPNIKLIRNNPKFATYRIKNKIVAYNKYDNSYTFHSYWGDIIVPIRYVKTLIREAK